MQDNAFGGVRVWVSAMRWKKHPHLQQITRNQLPGCLPVFYKTLFWLVYGSVSFPGWVPSQCLSSQKNQKMRAFSHQCKLMSVILFLPPHPVSVPGSQKALSITGIRKHSFSQRLCTIVSASCPCGRHNFLTPVDYRMGIQHLLKSLYQDTLISNPWPSYYTSWS